MSLEPLSFLLERVCDLLKDEASRLLVDEKEEIQSLKRELELIESFLKDIDEVERQATLNHVLQTKIQHLMQILPEIEDFLDEVMDPEVQQTQESPFKKLKACISIGTSNPLIRKYNLAKKVTEIREKLRETLQRPEGYQLPNNPHQVTKRRRIPTNPSIIKDEIIIGLEEDANTLVAKFLGKDGERATNSAIVGMGGSGKTTLAKKFYNHEEIKEAFPRRAWVCVSQLWNAHDLLLQICAMLGLRLSDDEKLIPRVKLQEFLEEVGSCLVVLDDVWEKNALQELLPTLLSGNGRVLITTRKEKIVKFPRIGAFYLHRARRLTPEQSWELFSRIVGNCGCEGVVDLEEGGDFARLGREMLRKCDGLPLAIITIAGLLGTKGTIQQWENIKDRVISIIMGDDHGSGDHESVKKVLELSYFDLPYYIKPCFLYLGTFKEDAQIYVRQFISLWIDEGFIKADQCPENRRPEEVAMDFLEELVQRCMVQVISRDYAGDVQSIRIHDLMGDLCMDKAKELGFFKVSSTTTTSTEIKPPYLRAIIHDRGRFVLDNPRLRSLIRMDEHRYEYLLPAELFPFEELKQLRVLSLHRVELGESAKQIENMVLLRHLQLFKCEYKIEKLDFIKKLRSLQTLHLWLDECLLKLPDNMVGSLKHLRVLILHNFRGGSCAPYINAILAGVGNLRNLQTLIAPPGEWLVKERPSAIISFYDDLRKLELKEIHSQPQLDAIQGCIGNTLTYLEYLHLSLVEESGLTFDLQKMKLGRCPTVETPLLGRKGKGNNRGTS